MEYITLNLSRYALLSYISKVYNTKLSGYRIKIKFDKDPLAVEQNNYLTKIVNVCIVYELNHSPKNPSINFKLKNYIFGATSIIKNIDKEKYVYSGYGITFDSADFWSYDNDNVRNFIISGVDNSSSSHSDNHKNNFLILGKSPTFGINESFGAPEKTFDVNFNKAKPKFCLSLHYNGRNSY